jgi:hypothetical protein
MWKGGKKEEVRRRNTEKEERRESERQERSGREGRECGKLSMWS